MRRKYDISKLKGGAQGKYYKSYRAGHAVKIHKNDGTTHIQYFKPEEGAVMLEPSLRKYFPDSDSVNNALQCLVPLLSRRRRSRVGHA